MTIPEHRVHLVYPFIACEDIERDASHLDSIRKKIASLNRSNKKKLLNNQSSNHTSVGNRRIWTEIKYKSGANRKSSPEHEIFSVSPDFNQAIRQLTTYSTAEEHKKVTSWVLVGDLGDTAERKVELNEEALKRLGSNETKEKLYLKLVGVHITGFESGIGFLDIEIKYLLKNTINNGVQAENEESVYLDLIREANYSICHRKGTYCSPVARLAESIFSDFGLSYNELSRRRTFVYTGIALKKDLELDKAKNIVEGIASLDTSAYRRTKEDSIFTETWGSGKNIVNSVTKDGGCLLVNGSNQNYFLGKFLDRNFNSYLNIARLNFHESLLVNYYAERLALLGNLNKMNFGAHRMLNEIKKRLYQYRLNYRFSSISEEPKHNRAHEAWRRTFKTDLIANEIDADVFHITKYLDSTRYENLKLSGKIITTLSACIGLIFTLDTVLKLGWQDRFFQFFNFATSYIQRLEISLSDIVSIIFALSLVTSLIFYSLVKPGARPSNKSARKDQINSMKEI